jgi:hypothetical protein
MPQLQEVLDMARVGKFEAHIMLGDIAGTTSSGINRCVYYNDRDDGAEVEIKAAYLTGVTTGSSTSYYTIALKNNAGTSMASKALDTATTDDIGATAPLSMGTITASAAKLADGESAYLNFTQTGNGMTIYSLGLHLLLEVHKSAT